MNILISSKRYIELCEFADSLNIKIFDRYSKKLIISKINEYSVSEEELNLDEQILTKKYFDFLSESF